MLSLRDAGSCAGLRLAADHRILFRVNHPLKRLFIVFLLSSGVCQAHAQQTLVEDSIFCPSLGRVKTFRVLQPLRGDDGSLRPGLLLLHGFGGNYTNWTALTGVKQIVDSLRLVVIMPDGGNSWYVNSVSDPKARFEDYIVLDLISALAPRFGIDTTRIGITGLSMGGYGSLVLGLRHPLRFRFVGAMSSTLDVPSGIPLLEQRGRKVLKASLLQSFGEDMTRWRGYDPFLLLSALDIGKAPYIYLVTGIQDDFLGRLSYHRSFVELLSARGFRYEYHETPGKHGWDFWAREVRGVIERFLAIVGEGEPIH